MSLNNILHVMPSECEHCKIIFQKQQPYEDVCHHINGGCKEPPAGITMQYGYNGKSAYHSGMVLTYEEFEKRRKENIMIDLQHTIFNCTRCGFRSYNKVSQKESVFHAAGYCMINCIHCGYSLEKLPPYEMRIHINGECMPKSCREEDSSITDKQEMRLEKVMCPNCGLMFDKKSFNEMLELHSSGKCRDHYSPPTILKIHEGINKRVKVFSEGWRKGYFVGIISGIFLGGMWMWLAIEVWKL